MMQPIQSAQSRLSGEHATPIAESNNQPASSGQMRVLNDLVSRLSTYTGQTNSEIWSLLRQDLGINQREPLLSRHFPVAEQNLNQRLAVAQQSGTQQQLLNKISELISQNNSRQPLSDYLTQQFGRASLQTLTSGQLQHVLNLLQSGQLTHRTAQPAPPGNPPASTAYSNPPASRQLISIQDIPRLSQTQLSQVLNETLNLGENRRLASHYLQQQFGHNVPGLLSPQQQKNLLILLLTGQADATASPATTAQARLTPSEMKTLNQLIVRLASSTGDAPARLWQTLLTLSDAPSAQQIPGSHFNTLANLLLAQQNLAQQPAPTLQQLQQYLQQHPQHSPQLSPQASSQPYPYPPIIDQEWQQLLDHAHQQWQITPQTLLTPAQIGELLYFITQIRIQRERSQIASHLQPIYNPFISLFSDPVNLLNSTPGLLLAAAITALVIFWIIV